MRYRKLDTKLWTDEKFRAFSDDGKLAFLYVLTHPAMTALGAMRATLAGLAAELGWAPRRFDRAIAPAVQSGMVEVNAAASFIALRNFLRYNRPESPNVARAWVAALDLIPECSEKQTLITRARESLTGSFREGFEEAFREAFGQPWLNPEPEPEPEPKQEQEQKQKQEGIPPTPLVPSLAGSSNGQQPRRRGSRKHVDADWGRA